jgi:hypothetical protein
MSALSIYTDKLEEKDYQPISITSRKVNDISLNVSDILDRTPSPKGEHAGNIKLQTKKSSYALVSSDLNNIINEVINSKYLSSETIDLLAPLSKVSDDKELKIALNVIASSHSLLTQRLEHAIEVNFKAYLPEKAPILYKEWKKLPENKGKNALDCLDERYGRYLELGVLFQDDLGGKEGIDPDLREAIKNYCRTKNIAMETKIPSKKEKTIKIMNALNIKKAQIVNNLYTKIKKTQK